MMILLVCLMVCQIVDSHLLYMWTTTTRRKIGLRCTGLTTPTMKGSCCLMSRRPRGIAFPLVVGWFRFLRGLFCR